MDDDYALFIRDKKGPIFRTSCPDYEGARKQAQQFADAEGFECLIYSFKEFREVHRCIPNRRPKRLPKLPHTRAQYVKRGPLRTVGS